MDDGFSIRRLAGLSRVVLSLYDALPTGSKRSPGVLQMANITYRSHGKGRRDITNGNRKNLGSAAVGAVGARCGERGALTVLYNSCLVSSSSTGRRHWHSHLYLGPTDPFARRQARGPRCIHSQINLNEVQAAVGKFPGPSSQFADHLAGRALTRHL